ncbi:hypothetical protein K9M74_01210 [Candidatus Woesearchaeota archaeon]|nr:hypothetical protein [Candidatus Woesearchaeota archaeon]
MSIEYEMYEKNYVARKTHPCINPRCTNFVEMQNSYNICMKCFDLLVDYLGSEHLIFDYSTMPALRRMTTKQLMSALRRAENKYPCVESVKRGSSNCQRRWHKRIIVETNRQKTHFLIVLTGENGG